jgi:replicative DNA helicase
MTFSAPSPGGLLLAPFSQEAEESVIGAVLISPPVFQSLSAFLKAEDFYLTRHRRMWEAYTRMVGRNDLMDLTTISEELRTMGALDEIGGYAYLIHLIGNTPNSMHAEAYGRLVERTSTRRRLLMTADQIRDLAMDEARDIHDVLRHSEKALLVCSGRHIMRRGGVIGDLIEAHAAEFERRLIHKSASNGIATGFRDVDEILKGFEAGQLIVLAGRPGMGKTSWLLSLVLQLARRGVGVIFHTMEMSADQLIHRLIALISGVSSHRQKDPSKLGDGEPGKVLAAYAELNDLPIYIEDMPSPTYLDVKSKSEWLIRSQGYQIVITDGLYRMSATFNTGGDDTRAYNEIAKGLKDTARELQVPVLTTHQLNRNVEDRNDKRPMLSDLRQSGRIEEEADIVMFLYRDIVYNPTTADPRAAELIVAKHRDGPVGRVYQGFDAPTTCFYDVPQPPRPGGRS